MLPIPPNIIFSLFVVPVFEWEAVEPAGDLAPAIAPPVCENGESATPEEPPASEAPARRLVFKGYEWQPGAHHAVSSASWEDCFTSGAGFGREDADRLAAERHAQQNELARRHAALATLARTGVAEGPGGPSTPPCDPPDSN